MITAKFADFVIRCQERNYDLDSASACIVSRDGDMITVDETHPSYPHARPGLGDRVAAGLAAVGITKERVSRVLGRKCKCKQRQAALNKLGQQAAAAIKRLTGGAQDAETATSEQERRVANRDA